VFVLVEVEGGAEGMQWIGAIVAFQFKGNLEFIKGVKGDAS
jgi:hypothetical protein